LRYTVRVRKGVYREIVRIPDDAWNVALIGDGAGITVITGSRAVDDDYPMPETATVGKPCVLCVSFFF
jgi:pectinesterase